MAYNITKTDGTNLVTIAEGTTDTNYSDLTLIGKNFAGYGEFINENFVHLLENFANTTAPLNPIRGQLWWNTTNSTLRAWNGTEWKAINPTIAQGTQPSGNLQPGDLWWDTANTQLKLWNGVSWTVVGPAYSSGSGVTGVLPEMVNDNQTIPVARTILSGRIGNDIVYIWSRSAFTPGTPIPGFSTIRVGLNISSNFNGVVSGLNSGTITAPSISFANANNTGIYSSSPGVLNVTTNGTMAATFAINGDFTAVGGVYGFSDEKLKKDWETLPADFVERLASVKSGTYARTDIDTDRQVGVSAQSLQTLLPEAIIADVDGILGVAYGNAALAACVELAKEVVALRKRVEDLEKK